MNEFDDYEEDEYYEPTIADEIMTEAIDKFKTALVKGKQAAAENLTVWEASLSQREQTLVDNKKELRKKEYDIKSKEKSLESDRKNLERNFYKTKLLEISDEMGKQYFEYLYLIDYRYNKVDKCKRCDENRKVLATRPDRTKIEVSCTCDTSVKEWYVTKIKCVFIKFSSGEKGFNFHFEYDNNGYEDYISVNNDSIYESVDSVPKEKLEKKRYYSIYFTTEVEAQKYIDEVLLLKDK